jgi:hypothetical protein
MGKLVELTVSFYNHLVSDGCSSVGIRYCPICRKDFDPDGTPWSTACEHVIFTYDYVISEFGNVHDSISDLIERIPEDADPPSWMASQIGSESVVCFLFRPQAGQDAWPAAIAIDLGASIKQV